MDIFRVHARLQLSEGHCSILYVEAITFGEWVLDTVHTKYLQIR